MPGKRFQVGERVWWVDSEDWRVLLIKIVEVNPSHCTIYTSMTHRYIYCVEHCMLYREEGAALLAATTALSNQITRATLKLDILFEKRKALQQRLYPELKGTNTHG